MAGFNEERPDASESAPAFDFQGKVRLRCDWMGPGRRAAKLFNPNNFKFEIISDVEYSQIVFLFS